MECTLKTLKHLLKVTKSFVFKTFLIEHDTLSQIDNELTIFLFSIFQFVPFRNFIQHGINSPQAKLHLAREVLAEIPDQFLGFMKANRLIPRRPPAGENVRRNLPPDPEFLAVNF
jgi:hypothetical protein